MSELSTVNANSETVAPSTPLNDVEALTNEMKRLLVRHESVIEHEGLRKQVETLERWLESYRRGLSAAQKIAENGPCWLHDIREQLKLAADELNRLESEGGSPATKEQMAQAEDFLKASRRIDQVLPNIEHIFCSDTTHKQESQLENA